MGCVCIFFMKVLLPVVGVFHMSWVLGSTVYTSRVIYTSREWGRQIGKEPIAWKLLGLGGTGGGSWRYFNRQGLLDGVKLPSLVAPPQMADACAGSAGGVGRHTSALLILFAFPSLALPVEGHIKIILISGPGYGPSGILKWNARVFPDSYSCLPTCP
jgi:hypothetical protein